METFASLREIEVQGVNVALALVDIAALRTNGEPSVLPFLTPTEKAAFHTFKVDKRKWEWAAGRLGVKLLVCDAYPGTEPNEVDVEPNWTKKPFARINGEFINDCVSITHSTELAVCGLARDGKLGLDVEHSEVRSPGMLKEAFSKEEQAIIGEFPDWREVTEQWTRKEAVAKALGIGLGLSLHDIKAVGEAEVSLSEKSSWRLCLDPSRRFVTHRIADLGDKWSDDYILTMCVLENETTILGLVDSPECDFVSGGLTDEQ